MKTKKCPTCGKVRVVTSFLLWWVMQKECLICRENRGIQSFIDLEKMVGKNEM